MFEPKGDEYRIFTRLHTHQHGTLALLTHLAKLFADIGGCRNRFAADVEDYVSGVEAVLGGNAIGIDRGHHHSRRACTRHIGSWRKRQDKKRVARRRFTRPGAALLLTLIRQFAKRQRKRLLLTIARDVERGRGIWAQ